MEQTTPTPPNGLPIIDEDIENVSASTSHYLRHHPIYFTIPLIAAVALEILIFLSKPSDPRIYLAPFFLPFIGYGIARSKIQHEFMQQFAAANGFSYALKGSLAGLDGSLFQVGDSRAVADVVSGQFQNEAISLFTYTYVTGYGRSRQAHNYTVYELQFDITLPDMLVENANHSYGESLFNKISGSGKELIKLEGDFDKYFSLNIQKGYEVEALEIFTPDVMAELINKAKALSLEIVNGHLFIYDNGIVGTKQGLYDLYGLAQYFIEKLGPVLARMKPSVVAMEQQAAEENL
ncbi:MAG: hypothetical protein WCF77_01740 [Minisyncoccia bacterium]